jgi:hypothetical protein
VDLQRLLLRDHAEIEPVFAAAERNDAIIVFDANRPADDEPSRAGDEAEPAINASALVQRCWRHRGLVIFTWIPGASIHQEIADQVPALVHPSVGTSVRFPFPAARTRADIWRAELPAGTKLDELDVEHLASSFRLSGGAIKRCCRAAGAAARAQRVPVSTALLTDAIEREYPDVALRAQMRAAMRKQRQPNAPRELGGTLPGSARWTRRIVVAVAVVSALLGFLLARGTSGGSASATPDQQASNALVRMSIPGSWHQQSAPAGITRSLSDTLAVAAPGADRGVLALGRAPAADPSLLVRRLTGRAQLTPPQIVALGALGFYRYSNVLPRGASSPESVYALATTAGTVLGVCAAQAAGAAFAAACERALGSIRLATGRPLAPGPSAALGAALDRVITKLSSARAGAQKRFTAARTAEAQASAAGALAAAHAEAASALEHVHAGRASTATLALAKAFQTTSDAYSAIARAASRTNAAAYRAASAQLSSALGEVKSALGQLNTLGYRIA